jgi:hypothetical protein
MPTRRRPQGRRAATGVNSLVQVFMKKCPINDRAFFVSNRYGAMSNIRGQSIPLAGCATVNSPGIA